MSRTLGVIQARMGSVRLPGKILAPLAGRPLLAQLVTRIRAARVDQWWLATSSHPADDVTEAWGFELGLRVYRGAAEDVLSRFVAIGRECQADWLVRVTADNPFLDAALVERLLDARDADKEASESDLVVHAAGLALEEPGRDPEAPPRRSPALPLGYGAELVRLRALERAASEIPRDPAQAHHRTHVTSWLHAPHSPAATSIRRHEVPTPASWPERGAWRWTVDTYEDLAMARGAFRLFGDRADRIDYPAMVDLLDAHPELVGLNEHVCQKPVEAG